MPGGVKYYSFVEATGYGLAAVAYVRGLVNAGVPVQWVPLRIEGYGIRAIPLGEPLPLAAPAAGDAALRDLAALVDATARPIDCDTILAHTDPEHWPRLFEPGKQNVGYTVWEADRPPVHWLPLLNAADKVCVPCDLNARAFVAAGVTSSIAVVPHIRRHAWNEFAPSEVETFRSQLGIGEDHFVFYSINSWTPRKNLPELLRAFGHAFDGNDPVTLLVKTPPTGYGSPPFYPEQATTELAQATIDAIEEELGRAVPPICLLPYELTGRGLDLVHEIGDCYVSLTHGEGWGLGAFDAATRGKPVVMTGWGGHLDYLKPHWTGAVSSQLVEVPIWPPHRPCFWPPQRWAAPNFDSAVETLRRAYSEQDVMIDEAMRIQASITNQYAEPKVTSCLLAAIDG